MAYGIVAVETTPASRVVDELAEGLPVEERWFRVRRGEVG